MTTETKKAGMSFEESRKNLLAGLQAKAGAGIVEEKVYFDNDDVPTFLNRLREFENKSREAEISIG
jgi:hypothetical protein